MNGTASSLFEPLGDLFLEDRGRERAKRFPPLDLGVEDRLHVGAARVADDRAVAERARAPFHAALEPADDPAVGDRGGGATLELAIRAFFHGASGGGDALAFLSERRGDLVAPVMRAPIGVVHHERPRVPEPVPHRQGGADRAAGVAGGRLHIDAAERRHPAHLAVGDRVHRAAAGEREIGEAGAPLQLRR